MEFKEYSQIAAINASAIKQGRKSMLHMKHYYDGGHGKDTACMRKGRQAHLCVLEPELFFPSLRVFDGDKRKKEWKEFKALYDADSIVTPDEMARLMAMRDAMHANADIKGLIDRTVHEHSISWEHDKYQRGKARFDMCDIENPLIGEYKTMNNISEWAFKNQISSMGYDIGAGWYCHGFNEKYGKWPDFLYIAQESDYPFDCYVMEVPSEIVRKDAERAVEIATRFHACRVANTFMGVANGLRLRYERPAWATKDDEWEVE
jgi:hypothetical protein